MSDTPCVLSYTVAPDTVSTGTTRTLTVTGTNQSGAPVAFTRRSDTIIITVPAGLCSALASIGCNTGSTGWSINALSGQPGTFLATPLKGTVTVPVGGSVAFALTNVQVDGTPGTSCDLEIDESVDGNDGVAMLAVTVTSAELDLTATATPPIVALGLSSTILFTATGADTVTLDPGGTVYKCSGGTCQGSFSVTPQAPSTLYTLTAAGGGQSKAVQVTVRVGVPVVDKFEPQKAPPIGFRDSVTLSWATRYANGATLSSDAGTQRVPLTGSMTVRPADAVLPNASSVVYTLSAQGYQGPTASQLTITFQPLEIVYFANTSPTGFPPRAVVNNGGAVMKPVGNGYALVATGPGGPLSRFCGTGQGLSLLYFQPFNSTVGAGTSVTLNWQAYAAVSATLNGQPVQLAADGSGSATFTVQQTTTYTLIITDADGNSVANSVTVTVA
ncbi:MAG TPA: hypothetical protein VK196_11965 [Magnetospirillum sp.]|nr:hypothetical protein [Magnetospirillum sp.]